MVKRNIFTFFRPSMNKLSIFILASHSHVRGRVLASRTEIIFQGGLGLCTFDFVGDFRIYDLDPFLTQVIYHLVWCTLKNQIMQKIDFMDIKFILKGLSFAIRILEVVFTSQILIHNNNLISFFADFVYNCLQIFKSCFKFIENYLSFLSLEKIK